MKYVMFIGDGMADQKQEVLSGKTPLEYLCPQGMAKIASGTKGRIRTCPVSMAPGSDVAFLTLLGNETEKVYAGRSTLEAAGMDVIVQKGETALRLNLVSLSDDGRIMSHNGGGIEGEDVLSLIAALKADADFCKFMDKYGLKVYETDSFRQIGIMPGDKSAFEDMTPPHDITGQEYAGYMTNTFAKELLRITREILNMHPVNQKRREKGLLPANALWSWGAGGACALESFEKRYGKKGIVVSAVPLVKGIAKLCSMEAPEVAGATGLLETNYEGKVACAMEALQNGYDFALLHVEAPDEMSHDGSLEKKLQAIRYFDERVIVPTIKTLDDIGDDYRVLVMPDHYTLLSTRTHDGTPVPYAIYDSRTDKGNTPTAFTEDSCADETILEDGDSLIKQLLQEK